MSQQDLGKNIKKLGFGLMRLPEKVDKAGELDHAQVCAMMDAYLAAGFSYVDTAYVYGGGTSEGAAKACLVDRYPRERFQLADKLPVFLAESREQGLEFFETSCTRCGVDYFDFYLLHALDGEAAKKAERLGLWDLVAELKAQGRVRHMGFSFHDKAAALDEILTRHPETEFVQLQINYKDWEDPTVQSRQCYEVARKHGKPVIIMEPVKGGSLAGGMIPEAQTLLRQARPEASVASWALRFAASLDGVITVLSGMSSLEQVADNVQSLGDFEPVNEAEKALLAQVAALLEAAMAVPCTDCRYCVDGCPQKIRIPQIFRAYNDYMRYRNMGGAGFLYNKALENGGGRAGDCVACGSCMSHCPQKLPIVEQLKAATEIFDKV